MVSEGAASHGWSVDKGRNGSLKEKWLMVHDSCSRGNEVAGQVGPETEGLQ